MDHDSQKFIYHHNFYLFFPICKRKEFKLFQLLKVQEIQEIQKLFQPIVSSLLTSKWNSFMLYHSHSVQFCKILFWLKIDSRSVAIKKYLFQYTMFHLKFCMSCVRSDLENLTLIINLLTACFHKKRFFNLRDWFYTHKKKLRIGKGTIQILRQQRGGWGQKMAIFADLQYYLCWRRRVGGPKKAKNMLT